MADAYLQETGAMSALHRLSHKAIEVVKPVEAIRTIEVVKPNEALEVVKPVKIVGAVEALHVVEREVITSG